jgi:hypothetical protein
MDKFITIQKEVFKFCERLENDEYCELMDCFVFNKLLTTDGVVGMFLDFTSARKSYERHLDDLNAGDKRYFLKCHGSDLYFLEDLKKALLVYSYNRWKNDNELF